MTSALLPLDVTRLRPGLRLAVGLSGGADSVALTRVLAARSGELGLVLHAAHLQHGLRGAEAEGDWEFAAELAAGLGLPFHTRRVDTAEEARARGEGLEESARRLRYGWFRELMAEGLVEAVATAHTLDDQAETVCGKFLRGAWTEGLSGIYPVVEFAEGRIVRPLLGATRAEVETYLRGLGQVWREDSSNRELRFTRNRLRHELLPHLEGWNPRLKEHLAQMAEVAREEERYWEAELARIAPQMLLEGRPVRGGGRAGSNGRGVALDAVRLGAHPVAIQRRLLRVAARRLGAALSFEATESLRHLALAGRAGQRLALPGPVAAERTARELRLMPGLEDQVAPVEEFSLPVPGEVEAFGWRIRAEMGSTSEAVEGRAGPEKAVVRKWRAGDRVTLRYSSGPRKIAEVLDRLRVSGSERGQWPVVEWRGEIVWMQGAELVARVGISIAAERV